LTEPNDLPLDLPQLAPTWWYFKLFKTLMPFGKVCLCHQDTTWLSSDCALLFVTLNPTSNSATFCKSGLLNSVCCWDAVGWVFSIRNSYLWREKGKHLLSPTDISMQVNFFQMAQFMPGGPPYKKDGTTCYTLEGFKSGFGTCSSWGFQPQKVHNVSFCSTFQGTKPKHDRK